MTKFALILKIKELEHDKKKLESINRIHNDINKLMLMQVTPLCKKYEKLARNYRKINNHQYSFGDVIAWATNKLCGKQKRRSGHIIVGNYKK